jgi:hypothetical protein
VDDRSRIHKRWSEVLDMSKRFIWAVVGLQLGATTACLVKADWKMAAYWFVIAIANGIATTF